MRGRKCIPHKCTSGFPRAHHFRVSGDAGTCQKWLFFAGFATCEWTTVIWASRRLFSFGVWPDVGLAADREQREAARKLLAKGDDPGEKIKLDRIAVNVAALAASRQWPTNEWRKSNGRADPRPL